MSNQPPFLELALEPTGGVSFANLEDFRLWFDEELKAWAWVRGVKLSHEVQDFINRALGNLDKIGNNLQTAWTQRGAAESNNQEAQGRLQYNGAISAIKVNLAAWAESGFRMTSRDPRAVHASEIAKTNASLGVTVLYAFLVGPKSVGVDLLTRAAVRAELFDQGISTEAVEARVESLGKLNDDFCETHGKVTRVLQESAGELTSFRDTAAKSIANASGSLQGLIAEANEKLTALESFYNDKLALLQPVTYWEHKRKMHSAWGLGFGIAFGILVASLIVGVSWLATHWLAPVISGNESPTNNLWLVGVFLALVGLAAWPVRVVARLMTSHLHLSADAHERVTLSKTYLAICRSDDPWPEAERKLILEALFRPAATGLVREEVSPHTTPEIIAKLIDGRTQ